MELVKAMDNYKIVKLEGIELEYQIRTIGGVFICCTYGISIALKIIEALEKQTMFHVFDISNDKGAWKDGYCKCGHYVTDGDNNCHNCGQKLDWEE